MPKKQVAPAAQPSKTARITSIQVANFKGFDQQRAIDLKPITVFLGPNSSGKSSSIHALGVLSQTLKVSNNTSPLTLDDDFSSIHLGRFIEVIHSRSYADTMTLGLTLAPLQLRVPYEKQLKLVTDVLSAEFIFKSTMRTQEIRLLEANYSFGGISYQAIREAKADRYKVTHSPSGAHGRFIRESGFLLEQDFRSMSEFANQREFIVLRGIQRAVQEALLSTLYLGPFRQAPSRRYPTRGISPNEVGPAGESAITILANEAVQTQTRPHIKQINKWLLQLGLAHSLDVARVGTSDLFDVNFTLADGADFPIADLGYGLSQILPVLTQCAFAKAGATLLFEQPELHLHSIPARSLSKIFAETAGRGVSVVLETHSPDLLRGLQQEIRARRLSPDDLIVYRVSRVDGHTEMKSLDIDADGDVYDNWEKGLSVE